MILASWGRLGKLFGSLLGRLKAILGVLVRSCGSGEASWRPPRPLWTISKASRAVLTVSRTHLGPFGRPFGALPGRLRPAKGVPGSASEAPKLSATAPLSLSVSLFGFIRCFRHLPVPVWAVFGASRGPLGAFLGPFQCLFWTLWGRLGPLPQTSGSKNGGAAGPAPSGAFN